MTSRVRTPAQTMEFDQLGTRSYKRDSCSHVPTPSQPQASSSNQRRVCVRFQNLGRQSCKHVQLAVRRRMVCCSRLIKAPANSSAINFSEATMTCKVCLSKGYAWESIPSKSSCTRPSLKDSRNSAGRWQTCQSRSSWSPASVRPGFTLVACQATPGGTVWLLQAGQLEAHLRRPTRGPDLHTR